MTPKQQAEFTRLKLRTRHLEDWNRRLLREVKALELAAAYPSLPPKGGLARLRWLTTQTGQTKLSASDTRELTRLLNWLDALPPGALAGDSNSKT